MKKRFVICLSAILCLILTVSAACADSITLSGKTVPARTVQIYAPVSGTVESIFAEEGQKVRAEDTLYTLKTTKVYAAHDGLVAGVFGQPGDDAETVGTRYGAILYLEEPSAYTVSASTSNAYNSAATKHVHTGETVWVVCRSNSARNGKGIITGVSGTSYEVEISEGTFLSGDSVEVYRNEAYDAELKIGRGTISRRDPTAVTATGAIVNIAVKDGTDVKRGDLLLETVSGTFDAYAMTGTETKAGTDGIIGTLRVQAGENVEKGTVAAEIYPMDRMRVEANIPEDYCSLVHEGDPVTIELVADTNRSYPGTIVLISSIASEGEEEVSYRIVAEFVPDETVKFGMNVLINAGEEEPEMTEDSGFRDENPEDKAETEESMQGERPEWPEGMPERGGEGSRFQRPEGGRGGRPENAPERTGEEADTGAGQTNP